MRRIPDEAFEARDLYGMSEIATVLGLSPGVVRQWRHRGALPDPDVELAMGPIWFGGRVASSMGGDLVAWLADRLEREFLCGPGLDQRKVAVKAAREAAEFSIELVHGPIFVAFAANAFRAAAGGLTDKQWYDQLLVASPELHDSLHWAEEVLLGDGHWPWVPFGPAPSAYE